jgi:hypothetical protein
MLVWLEFKGHQSYGIQWFKGKTAQVCNQHRINALDVQKIRSRPPGITRKLVVLRYQILIRSTDATVFTDYSFCKPDFNAAGRICSGNHRLSERQGKTV